MRRTERGVSAVAVAVVLALLCGFVALSLDVGHLLSVRGELQNGSDAGALAGAKSLTGRNTSGELGDAVDKARLYATSHPTDRYNIEPKTIELGAWVPSDHACPDSAVGVTAQRYGYKFCQITATREGAGAASEEAAADINAVRVVSAREGTPGAAGGGAVELGFGGFVGHKEPAPVGAEAIAVLGGPCGEQKACLPFVVREGCVYEEKKIRCDKNGVGPVYFVGFSAATRDSAGMTSLSTASATPQQACTILKTCPPVTDGSSTPRTGTPA